MEGSPGHAPRLLVIGASGYLGRELCTRGRVRGWEVVGTHLSQPVADVELDVRDRTAVCRVVAATSPGVVVNTAYVQAGDTMGEVNTAGAEHVAVACEAAGAALVHISTDFVFDGESDRPYREEDPTVPVNAYGRSKLAGERAVIARWVRSLVVRTSLIYGGAELSPHERMVVDALAGERDVAFYEDELRSPVAVADLAEALLELCRAESRGVLHLAGPDPVSRLDFARAVAGAQGADPDRLRQARSADQPVRRPLFCALDSARARAMLATRMRPVAEVLTAAPAEPFYHVPVGDS